jgi:hypothetical protein
MASLSAFWPGQHFPMSGVLLLLLARTRHSTQNNNNNNNNLEVPVSALCCSFTYYIMFGDNLFIYSKKTDYGSAEQAGVGITRASTGRRRK